MALEHDERAGAGGAERTRAQVVRSRQRESMMVRIVAAVVVLALTGGLIAAVLEIEDREPAGLADHVRHHIEVSGVENAVTAVLLNFRSYDTLLEIGVLLLAAWAVLALRQDRDVRDTPRDAPVGVMLGWLVRLGVPMMILGAGYLLWLGSRWPGGAFQAGAVLGAAGVTLRLAGGVSVAALTGWRLRVGLALGFAAFALLGLMVMLTGGAFLEYPEAWATVLIVAVEVLATVSIGLTLALLFIAGEAGAGGNGERAAAGIEA